MSLIFATQLTAVATVALAMLAIAAAIVAGTALRKQSRELAILVADNNRQARERRRAQAASVYIGLPLRGNRLVQPAANNASSLPVFDAQFWYSSTDGLSGPDDLGMIMPGPVGINGRQMRYDEAVKSAILTFRDAEGIRWIRMADGTLEEQTRPTARESIQAALEPDLPMNFGRQPDQVTGPVIDAIIVNPRSYGQLSLKFSEEHGPPDCEVTVTSDDGSTQGVYTKSRTTGDAAHLALVWDVWNNRDTRVYARLVRGNAPDPPDGRGR
jgi:hypothetical protein